MSTLRVRDYAPGDFRRLCEIDRLCFEPRVAYRVREMASLLRRAEGITLVAENTRREVVAFVSAHHQRQGKGHIVTLDVLPGYRGRGLGRRLMRLCERRLVAAGVRTLRLETSVHNRAAQALYRSLGYTFLRRVPRYYPNGEDGWILEKTLVRA